MPETKQITFTYQEVAEMMVRNLEINEGLWGVYIKFGIQAGNVGAGPDDLRPSAIVPVLELGLQRFDGPTNLTVDAAEVVKATPKKAKATKQTVSAT